MKNTQELLARASKLPRWAQAEFKHLADRITLLESKLEKHIESPPSKLTVRHPIRWQDRVNVQADEIRFETGPDIYFDVRLVGADIYHAGHIRVMAHGGRHQILVKPECGNVVSVFNGR